MTVAISVLMIMFPGVFTNDRPTALVCGLSGGWVRDVMLVRSIVMLVTIVWLSRPRVP